MTRALKDVNGYTAVFVLREQICAVMSCGCVFATQRFEGTYRRPLQDYESHGLITLKRKAVRSLERPGRNYPKTTAQQHTRTGSSIVTQWKPQIVVFVLLKMYIISDYFNFNRLLCRVYARKIGTIKVSIFGRQSS